MGVAGSNLLLHRPGMGQELHAADGLLHRLRPDVQQVPRRIIHPRHSGIHHSPAGNLCLEARVGRTRNMESEQESVRHQPCADRRCSPAAYRSAG